MIEIELQGERLEEFRTIKRRLQHRRGVEPRDEEVLMILMDRYESEDPSDYADALRR